MERTLFVVFGITGDLAQRKILPALYLMNKDSKHNFETLGVGRRDFDDQDLFTYLSKEPHYTKDTDGYNEFLKKIKYFKVELSEQQHYQNLLEHLQKQRDNFDNIIIYLSISPDFFGPVLANIKKFGIQKYIDRIAFEKPFGFDLASATHLNNEVGEVFTENQIYRIDHYMGKEAVQNIMNFRFSNIFFDKIWNNEYIDNIQIIANEKIGILGRGEYYDNYGALRDMLQNHVMQILAQVTIQKPKELDFPTIKAEKAKTIKALRLFDNDPQNIIFAQYEGYLQEKGVNPGSRTDSFVAAKLEVNTPHMKGVPIYVKTGKSLDEKITKVIVQFKKTPYYEGIDIPENKIIFDIGNKEIIHIDFNVKKALENKGIKTCPSFFNECDEKIDAYYRLISDIMSGESLLFPRRDMIHSSWEFIDYLVNLENTDSAIHSYKVGSKGPLASEKLLQKDDRKWFE